MTLVKRGAWRRFVWYIDGGIFWCFFFFPRTPVRSTRHLFSSFLLCSRREEPLLLEDLDDGGGHLLGWREGAVAALLGDLHDDLGVLGLLVRVVDAGETLDLPRTCSLVQPFGILQPGCFREWT